MDSVAVLTKAEKNDLLIDWSLSRFSPVILLQPQLSSLREDLLDLRCNGESLLSDNLKESPTSSSNNINNSIFCLYIQRHKGLHHQTGDQDKKIMYRY